MSDFTLQQLTDAYQDYFSVEHKININATVLQSPLPDQAHLEKTIPAAFLMASESSSLNNAALRSLNRLGELADELAQYLQQQARKIDLLMQYILRQQDSQQQRYQTLSYGGSGCCFLSESAFTPLQVLELKIFLDNNDGAVFCYGQVLSCEAVGSQWQVSAVFNCIREEDRELIVRASLHQQSRLLKLKAEQRQQNTP
ncbi:PilZ domain-containing protein [Rheinheimera maricola]|uniref:PilZ domain-containing protein n=1 Tax=Rheinheimera maricola TaxID=2793282 RepID=A0ABS7X642_9GAMM|nr:PilZ domain-containing protein [Rheinheimera maricola]MBZ9610649.1 PilZ domain-containing protein [Rheinheimera maricola]